MARTCLALVLVLCGAAACASTGGKSPGGTVTAGTTSLPQITVRRTGGFAGVNDELTVDPHGAWTATDKAGNRRTGQLATADIAAVGALAADPRLATEAHRPTVPTRCRDAFVYAVTVGATEVGYTDCSTDPGLPTATIALVARLQQATG